MTKHFKLSLAFLLAAALAVFGGFEWVKHRLMGDLPGIHSRPPVVLPKNDKEVISFNERRHIVSVTTAKGTIREYAKNPTIEIRKDGTVKIDRHLVGFEIEPFMGFGYASRPVVFLGADVFHFSHLELNGSIGFTSNSLAIYTGVGYNFWGNTSLNVSVNPIGIIASKPDIALFVSVKF
jgi:hypothetical protein